MIQQMHLPWSKLDAKFAINSFNYYLNWPLYFKLFNGDYISLKCLILILLAKIKKTREINKEFILFYDLNWP